MKNVWISLVFLFFFPFYVAAQNSDCKVLMPEIDSVYQGKCKKGLAHGTGTAIGKDSYIGKFKKGWPDGKGVYTWSSGEVYEGYFNEGLRDGQGSYRYVVNGKDTLLTGIWKEDVYIGQKPKKPRVAQQVSIDRYNIRKNTDVQNRVLIDFYQNGASNKAVTDLLITADSGYEFNLGQSKGFKDMTFPVSMLVKYTTPNKLQTALVHSIFEFIIYEPGDWRVELFN